MEVRVAPAYGEHDTSVQMLFGAAVHFGHDATTNPLTGKTRVAGAFGLGVLGDHQGDNRPDTSTILETGSVEVGESFAQSSKCDPRCPSSGAFLAMTGGMQLGGGSV